MKEMTLYAVIRDGLVTGVFTTQEAASRCGNAEVSLIRVPQLPGSPEARGWVIAALGEWTSLSMNAQGVQSETVRVGPCWGVNLQTAVAGLCAPGGNVRMGFTPRHVTLTDLRLYRLDQDDGLQCPDNLRICAAFCLCDLQAHGAFPDEELGEDYIALHEREEQRGRDMKERLDSGLPDLLAVHVLGVACARAPGKRGFCGTYLSRAARDLDLRIARCFTLREMEILCEELQLQADLPVDLTEIPAEEKQKLLSRLDRLTPRVRRTTGVRSENEDPTALARWILHPGMMDTGDLDIDIPEDTDA